MKKALIHRYDNEPDILAVEAFGFSDVYLRARDDSFEIVIVVPTRKAKTDRVAVGTATSNQISPHPYQHWPGRPDGYRVRVRVKDVRYTTYEKVRLAVLKAGRTWAAQWQVNVVLIDETELF